MFLDIALGILLSIFGNQYFQIELTPLFILICILFTLSPDLDYLIYLIKKRGKSDQMDHGHRDILHYPLIFIPLGILILLPFGTKWSVLFGLGAFLHFLHDSVGIGLGWGIQWLWPFSKNYYYFFRKSLWTEKRGLPLRFLYVWKPEEVKRIAAEYGDPNWIKNFYLRLNPILIIEVLSLLVALFIVFRYLSK